MHGFCVANFGNSALLPAICALKPHISDTNLLRPDLIRGSLTFSLPGLPMSYLTTAVVVLVAMLHIQFMILEMLLWTRPFGLKTFSMSKQKAEHSAVLAASQGLYNGFLAAGLIIALFLGNCGYPMLVFLLGCIIIAGIYGGLTAKRTIWWLQGFPAGIALLLVVISHG
jgi:putative membrane protein